MPESSSANSWRNLPSVDPDNRRSHFVLPPPPTPPPSCTPLPHPLRLTLHLTSSPRFALLSSLFYALSPSPAVLSAPYTEPLFALLSFSGFLFIEESFALGSGSRSGNNQSPHSHGGRAVARKAVLGTLCLAATTMIRSLGTTSCLVVVWRGVVDPLINGWKGGARVRGSMQVSVSVCWVGLGLGVWGFGGGIRWGFQRIFQHLTE